MEALTRPQTPTWHASPVLDRVRLLVEHVVSPGISVTAEVQRRLIAALFASGATIKAAAANAALVSMVVAFHFGTFLFAAAAALQIGLALLRVGVHRRGEKALAAGGAPPVASYALASLSWAAVLGVEMALCIASGDWIAATLVSVSGAAMAGGMCLRNFSAPRLAKTMVALSLGPGALAAVASGEFVMLIAGLQLPLYIYAMGKASAYQNRLWVRSMEAELLNDHHAHHDWQSGLLNRAGLIRWLKQAPSRSCHLDGGFAFVFLEVEGLTEVSRTLGHAAAEHVAKQLAERLRLSIGEAGEVSRLGDGEFVAILKAICKPEVDEAAARLIGDVSDRPYQIGGDSAVLIARAGIAVAPRHGTSFVHLLEAADAGLCEARLLGRSYCHSPYR